jgi:hypothetical protein
LGFDGVVDLSMVCVGCFDIMLSERGYCVVENQIWKFYVEDVVSVGFCSNESPYPLNASIAATIEACSNASSTY